MIDNRIFQFHDGVLTYLDNRFFVVEASLTYLVEEELKKLKNGQNSLFKLAFNYGKRFASGDKGQNPTKFVGDFMSAMGWGDVLVMKKNGKYEVIVNYFPWTRMAEKSNLVLFRGMVSGMISGLTGKDIRLQKVKTSTTLGYLNVVIKE
jgi:hypothetical protein